MADVLMALVGFLLLLGTWRLTTRVRLLENRLGERMDCIPELNGQLDHLTRYLRDEFRPAQRAELQRLHGELEQIRSMVERLREEALRPVEPARGRPQATPLHALEQQLATDGFGGVRLSEPEHAGPEQRVAVEAIRSGITYRGFAFLKAGEVREVVLKPAYEASP